ncbi:MAG: hypothetical protein BWY80_00492 [Firmicutes bacterium ADurb.Bin456]|nr:MAG: hypothetical protein BWY80_00492 [Firmicutes bacterium ADurb.Bin456]
MNQFVKQSKDPSARRVLSIDAHNGKRPFADGKTPHMYQIHIFYLEHIHVTEKLKRRAVDKIDSPFTLSTSEN